jgi:hypothetical protein
LIEATQAVWRRLRHRRTLWTLAERRWRRNESCDVPAQAVARLQPGRIVAKLDVGRFDRNVDVAERYGVPLKSGIPVVGMLFDQRQVVYATKPGEPANARKMGDRSIYDFFAGVAAARRR